MLLQVRLLHAMLSMSPAVEEQLRLLPGPYFFLTQHRPRPPPPPDARALALGGGAAGGGGPPEASVLQPMPLPLPAAPHPPTAAAAAPSAEPAPPEASGSAPPVTLVCFIGGCTLAELSALRWLGRNATPRRSYLVMTTGIVNGDAMIESLMATCDNGLEKLE